ncbi:hypothetical protein FACS1894109_15170 [Spirochaetia bacterium]|nr:hypothetical protein FACS1894109_15170 [Spirochaetia bacterium]
MKKKSSTMIPALLTLMFITAFVFTACPKGGEGVSVESVTLSPAALSIAVGASGNLTATVAPADADDKTVVWSSSDTTKAIVADGIVTGVAEGAVTITVSTTDGGKTAAAEVIITGDHSYGISLSQTGTYTFPAAAPGYGARTGKGVIVTNTGSRATGALTVELSGTGHDSFTLPQTVLASIAIGENNAFTVVPNTGLAAGTHTATVTVSGGNGITASFDVSFTVSSNPIYGINLDVSGTHTFPVEAPGYGTQTEKSVTITNTGNQATGALTAALSGIDSGSFILSTTSIGSIAAGGTGSFTVVPNTGLTAGTYSATVTVSGGNGITASFDVSFTVSSNPIYGINLDVSGTHTFPVEASGYGTQTEKSVTITNTGNQATGALTAALSGTNSTAFSLSTTSIGSIAAGGTGSFTVVPNTGLTAGTYSATVTVSGGNGITAGFNVSFTVNALVNAATPTISVQPLGASYGQDAGATALTVSAGRTDGGVLSYQWYKNTSNSATSGTPVGTNSASYTPVTSATGTLYYYVVVTNTNNSVSGTKTATATSSVATVTVTPTGDFIYTVSSGNITITGYTGASTNLTIPSTIDGKPVTSIEGWAFYNCSNLTSVTIGNSVTSIGDQAFYGCSSLTSITIGNSVTSIGDQAFYGCSSLTSVVINTNYVVTNFKSIFTGYSGLTLITIGNSVTSIGDSAFSGCSGLTSVTIPNSVTSIGDRAFEDCSGLTSVTIPNSVTSIGYRAFEDCRDLTSVTIPDSVTSIGDQAFSGCSGLTSVTIPNSVTSIGHAAFYDCNSLTSVTIPNSVTSSIGDSAFYNCTSLTSVTIGNGVTSIDNWAFYNCTSLTSVTIPNSVTSIDNWAFYFCNGLTSVTIPNSVTSIGDKAFYHCIGLTSVTIPNSVTSIGDWAFYDCIGLTSVYVLRATTPLTTLGIYGFYSTAAIYVPTSVVTAYKGMSGWSSYASRIQAGTP